MLPLSQFFLQTFSEVFVRNRSQGVVRFVSAVISEGILNRAPVPALRLEPRNGPQRSSPGCHDFTFIASAGEER